MGHRAHNLYGILLMSIIIIESVIGAINSCHSMPITLIARAKNRLQ